MKVGKVPGQGRASQGVGDGPDALTFSVEESGDGWKQSRQSSTFPAILNWWGKGYGLALGFLGFRPPFGAAPQRKAAFRLTTRLGGTVAGWWGSGWALNF